MDSVKYLIGRWFGQQPRVIPANVAKYLNPQLVKAIEALPPDSLKMRQISARCIHFEQLLLQGKFDIAKIEAELREMLKSSVEEQNGPSENTPKKTKMCTDVSTIVPQQQGLQPYVGGMSMLQSTSLGPYVPEKQQQLQMPNADYSKALEAQANGKMPTGIGFFGCKAAADIVESRQKTYREMISHNEKTRRTFIGHQAKRDIALDAGATSRYNKHMEVYKHQVDTIGKDREGMRQFELARDPDHQQFTLKKMAQKNDHEYRMEVLKRGGMDHEYRMEALKLGVPIKLEKKDEDEQSQEPIVVEPESEDAEEEQEQKEETTEG